jgi:FtsP/CotA-like multicopper oxidase with cupredoxin domain
MNIEIIPLLLLTMSLSAFAQQTVRYDLYVSDTTVHFAGKSVKAIAVDGQIPGPTLNFTEGDTAEIYVHNLMDEATSIHWHGVILPNEQDGVPYLTDLCRVMAKR